MKPYYIKYLTLLLLASLFGCSTFHIERSGVELGMLEQGSGRVLLVTAHQDDEVFIASRLLQHLSWQDTVQIIWTASGQKDSAYEITRKLESIKGCKYLGIDSVNCTFLDFIDGETYKHLNEIYSILLSKVEEFKPNVIYIPAFEGGHIDHDIVHFATAKAAKILDETITIFEYPEYSAYRLCFLLPFKMRNYPRQIRTSIRELSKEEFNKICDLWDIYESQHFPLDLYLSLVSGTKRTFGFEYLRKLPKYDYSKLEIYYGNIAYERYLWGTSYTDFLEAIDDFTYNPQINLTP